MNERSPLRYSRVPDQRVHQMLFPNKVTVLRLQHWDDRAILYELDNAPSVSRWLRRERLRLTAVDSPYVTKMTCMLELVSNSETCALYEGSLLHVDGTRLYVCLAIRTDLELAQRNMGKVACARLMWSSGLVFRRTELIEDVDIFGN